MFSNPHGMNPHLRHIVDLYLQMSCLFEFGITWRIQGELPTALAPCGTCSVSCPAKRAYYYEKS